MSYRLAIAMRELRLAAHSVQTYRKRAGIALAGGLGIACAFAGFEELGRRSSYLLGQTVFMLSAWTLFLVSTAAFGATADTISSEKRHGTLGLLFLTHLSGRDVVTGKLLAGGLRFFAGIVALFPILLVPVLVGGVSSGQGVRLFLSVTNMMLFSASAGLLASTLSHNEQHSQSKALQIILLLAGGPPLGAFLLRYFSADPSLGLALDLLSPLYAQRTALGGLVGPQLGWFYLSTLIVLATSCLTLAMAAWLVPRTWQEGRRRTVPQMIGDKLGEFLHETLAARSFKGQQLLDRNPFQWLVVRDLSFRRASWLAVFLPIALAGLLHPVLSMFWPQAAVSLFLCLPLLFILLTFVKMRVGQLAVSQIAMAKEYGILETIVGTRLRTAEIVVAQFRALWFLLGGPLFAFLPICIAAFFYSLPGIDRLADTFTSPPELGLFRCRAIFVLSVALIFLFFDSITLTWVGMFCAFKFSRPAKARSWTGFLVLAFPHCLFLGLVVALLSWPWSRPAFDDFYPPVLIWIATKFLNNLLLIFFARAVLRHTVDAILNPSFEQSRDLSSWPSRTVLTRMIRRNLMIGKARERI